MAYSPVQTTLYPAASARELETIRDQIGEIRCQEGFWDDKDYLLDTQEQLLGHIETLLKQCRFTELKLEAYAADKQTLKQRVEALEKERDDLQKGVLQSKPAKEDKRTTKTPKTPKAAKKLRQVEKAPPCSDSWISKWPQALPETSREGEKADKSTTPSTTTTTPSATVTAVPTAPAQAASEEKAPTPTTSDPFTPCVVIEETYEVEQVDLDDWAFFSKKPKKSKSKKSTTAAVTTATETAAVTTATEKAAEVNTVANTESNAKGEQERQQVSSGWSVWTAAVTPGAETGANTEANTAASIAANMEANMEAYMEATIGVDTEAEQQTKSAWSFGGVHRPCPPAEAATFEYPEDGEPM